MPLAMLDDRAAGAVIDLAGRRVATATVATAEPLVRATAASGDDEAVIEAARSGRAADADVGRTATTAAGTPPAAAIAAIAAAVPPALERPGLRFALGVPDAAVAATADVHLDLLARRHREQAPHDVALATDAVVLSTGGAIHPDRQQGDVVRDGVDLRCARGAGRAVEDEGRIGQCVARVDGDLAVAAVGAVDIRCAADAGATGP